MSWWEEALENVRDQVIILLPPFPDLQSGLTLWRNNSLSGYTGLTTEIPIARYRLGVRTGRANHIDAVT